MYLKFPVCALALCTMPIAFAQWHAKDTEWPSYNADLTGSR